MPVHLDKAHPATVPSYTCEGCGRRVCGAESVRLCRACEAWLDEEAGIVEAEADDRHCTFAAGSLRCVDALCDNPRHRA